MSLGAWPFAPSKSPCHSYVIKKFLKYGTRHTRLCILLTALLAVFWRWLAEYWCW